MTHRAATCAGQRLRRALYREPLRGRFCAIPDDYLGRGCRALQPGGAAHIANGVDTDTFAPAAPHKARVALRTAQALAQAHGKCSL